MSCRVCVLLQESVEAAQRPDTPAVLLGLTEAGLRNRAHQMEERQVKAELELEKHRRYCRELGERAAG